MKELCALKYTVVTDISKQYWTCFLKDIPNDPENITMYFRDRVEEETNDDMVLLEVRKPEFQQCPQPPELIREWLEYGWDRFTNTPSYTETLNDRATARSTINDSDSDTAVECFGDSDSRIQAFEKWVVLRSIWADKQRVINGTRLFFARLFQAYTDIEREFETLEFVVGNGLIKDINNQSINHPVLLKRVKFDFNAKENIIRISDTDTEPELYTLLLQEMTDINYGVVRQLKEDLHEYFYHPLDRNDTPDFLKTLTHRLCSESKYIGNDDDQPGCGDRIVTRCAPVFFIRRRIDGTLKSIEEIIANIENTGYVPGHLIDLVGAGTVEIPINDHELTIDEQLAALSGENADILLSKEANREQLEIAERIEHYNAVLVQGPPGTGKTHTIANLLGHFLAQGKSVLVTSQTKKALSVLKDQVPEAIQNLCVSVLDDTNLDMVRSVDGISEYLSRYTSNELKKKMESSARQRTEIIERLAEIRRKIYAIKYREFEPIVYSGDGYSPAEAAEFVSSFAEELSYIPGKVRLYHEIPVSVDELYLLYRSNASISLEDEAELACEIPNPELLTSPAMFSADIQAEIEGLSTLERIGKSLSLNINCDFIKGCLLAESESTAVVLADSPTSQALEDLASYVKTFNSIDGWMIQAAIDGHKGGGFKQKWEMLISSIEVTATYAESIVTIMLGKTVTFTNGVDPSKLKPQIIKILDIFQRKGKISKIDFLFNKQLESALSLVTINGNAISSADDCTVILSFIELLEKRTETERLWDELMAKQGSPAFSVLGPEPEEICEQRISNIKRYLSWYHNEYAQFINLVDAAGLNSDVLFDYSDLDSERVRTEKVLKSIYNTLPLHIRATELFIDLSAIEQRRRLIISVLSEGKRKNSTACIATISAIRKKEIDQYEEEYCRLSQLFEKYTLHAKRIDILAKIEPLAPEWAASIAAREGIHGATICPGTIEQAWKWKQFAGIIEEITAEPFEELQKKSVVLSQELRTKTAELAANKAWYHLLLRTEQNLEMKQALVGWKLTVKKIGKGTGKNAPTLRKQARSLMAKCQAAVPAWIIPVGKALESLDPSKNLFDVVIVDEASQSDVSALAIMYMAKKVIIVGDDKQVSPMAVGVDIDRMNALREMYIKDTIPNWHLYDAKTSLYDIAGTTYQPLMLREHFRCVPDIIGYSNKLAYDFKIKPLRDASNCVVVPPVVQYRVVNGQREGHRKINIREAESVVSLMMACMEQPEYERETFGAISLLGDDQAKLIQQIVFKRLEPAVIEERRILCGNASHFQGDERNVIFLSIVDSNEGDGPLKVSGEGVEQSTKQRYNVAASRAKDQLWIVHSLDYSKDLKTGDMRRDLLEYADNPKAYSRLAEDVKAKAESPFEEAVGKSLVAAGYHITQQWEVGAYRIDMVVQHSGKKIAVECDGEQYHSGEEKVRADMERQTILERMGWRFIRIRGSEYYRDPDAAMSRVIDELTDYGILRESMVESITDASSSELLSRIKIRSAQIMDEWHSEDENAVEDMSDIKNKVLPTITALPHTISPEIKNLKENTTQKTEGFMQISISQLEADCKCEPRDSMQSVAQSVPTIKDLPKQPIGVVKTDNKKALQSEDIIVNIKKAGIQFVDNRSSGGSLWIIGGQELSGFVKECSAQRTYFKFRQGGGRATGGKDGWWAK